MTTIQLLMTTNLTSGNANIGLRASGMYGTMIPTEQNQKLRYPNGLITRLDAELHKPNGANPFEVYSSHGSEIILRYESGFTWSLRNALKVSQYCITRDLPGSTYSTYKQCLVMMIEHGLKNGTFTKQQLKLIIQDIKNKKSDGWVGNGLGDEHSILYTFQAIFDNLTC